jgi:hypothetical protein
MLHIAETGLIYRIKGFDLLSAISTTIDRSFFIFPALSPAQSIRELSAVEPLKERISLKNGETRLHGL